MNKKIGGGLAVGAILILLVVLYYLWSSGLGKIGPSAVTAPEPPGATVPAKPETPAAPTATQPGLPLNPQALPKV